MVDEAPKHKHNTDHYTTPTVNINCRYYEQPYPSVDDLVIVEIKSVEEMGAYVALLEYDNREGMIMLSEFSRKRIRSVSKLTRVGKKEVVVVIRVDPHKGYIDLSKKRVSPDEIAECENKYKKAKEVHSILRQIAQTKSIDIEVLYEKIGWPLYRRFEHAYDAFKLAVNEPDVVFEGLDVTPDIKEALCKSIQTRLAPKDVKIRADFSLTCYEFEGIDAIKEALLAGLAKKNERMNLSIKLIASPNYVMVLTTPDRAEGISYARECLDAIDKCILGKKGNFVLKEAPHFINDQGDLELEELIRNQTLMNKNTSDLDEDQEEGMDVDLGIDEAEMEAHAADNDDDDFEEDKQ